MHAAHSPCLFFPGAKHDPGNAGGQDGARAHDTRFEGHHESHVGELPSAERVGGFPDRNDFRVSGRIFCEFALIATTPDDRAGGIDDDRPDGNITGGKTGARLSEGVRHQRFVHPQIETHTVTTSAVQ